MILWNLYFILVSMSERNSHIATTKNKQISKAFNTLDLMQFSRFYRQLKKLKAKRKNYRIEFVIKNVYPILATYTLSDIDTFIEHHIR